MRTSTATRFITLFSTVSLILLSLPVTAAAVAWGPMSSSYNGSVRVSGSGSFTNSGNTRATTTYTITDRQQDGNSVYGTTRGYIYGPAADNAVGWNLKDIASTPEFSNTTRTYTTSFRLNATGTKARGQIYVCAQMGFPVPDSCSDAAYPSFNY